MENNDKAVQNVIEDKAFLTSVMQMNMADAQKAFAERGVILSDDEMIAIRNLVAARINNKNSLPEKDLENIGGGKGKDATKKIKNIAIALSAMAIGGTAITLAYKGYQALDATTDAMKSTKEAADKVSAATAKANQVLDNVADVTHKANEGIELLLDPTDKGTTFTGLFGPGIPREHWKKHPSSDSPPEIHKK